MVMNFLLGGVSPLSLGTALRYVPPTHDLVDEDDVRVALDFLVAINPEPEPATRRGYEAATAPYRLEIGLAAATLRRFAEQAQPRSLASMQRDYYGFTNDQRYLTSALASSTVTGSLRVAWHGVGPWRW